MIPVLARTRLGLAAARGALGSPVALVPTMGALHEGHRALLRRARELAGPGGGVLVSAFVNPLQFGPGEDFGRYPRTLDTDLAVCGEEGAAVVFAPDSTQMYPRQRPSIFHPEPGVRQDPGRTRLAGATDEKHSLVTVDPGPMGRVLEGESRPGFFTGVLTVVLKLFQLTRPHVAVFGEKDAQQLALVCRMVLDLDLGVEIASVPIVRDPDGLATSSRNRYLSQRERASALALPAALRAGAAAWQAGPEGVMAAAQRVLDEASHADPPVRADYLALVDPATFTPVKPGYEGGALLLAAASVGATRLIDNTALTLAG